MTNTSESNSADGGADLRILIENSEYWLRNIGDLAMLSVTVARLRARWPDATIGILTDSPALLSAYFPDAKAITVKDRDPWSTRGLRERLAARLGPRAVAPFAIAAIRFRRRLSAVVKAGLSKAGAPGPLRPSSVTVSGPGREPSAAVADASLVVVLGGGYLADADKEQATRVFELLGDARRGGVPYALVGQGLGPLTDPELRSLAAAVLADAGLLAVRERRRGPPLLDSLGVPPDRVVVTGDDAIELAYAHRRDRAGTELGLCLRVAPYSPVAEHARDTVGRAVRAAALRHRARLSPLIISEHLGEDRRSTMPLVQGHPGARRPTGRHLRPAAIADRVAACRVVVTGAYHLAVFALSQGIPVVGLTSTDYYDDKLHGLADMFEGGLAVVDLRSAALESELGTAIESAWASATDIRPALRAAATEQIDLGKSAYQRVFALVEHGETGRGDPARQSADGSI